MSPVVGWTWRAALGLMPSFVCAGCRGNHPEVSPVPVFAPAEGESRVPLICDDCSKVVPVPLTWSALLYRESSGRSREGV